MIRNCFCILWFLCLVLGCNTGQSSSQKTNADKEYLLSATDSIRYAVGYEVTSHEGYKKVEVRDPWNKKRLLQRYLLVPRGRSLPENLPKGTLVRTPVRKIVVYTSVHLSILNALGVKDDIVGVCEVQYIKSPEMKKRIGEGLISDLGNSMSPNIEKMIALEAEVIFASPFENAGYGSVETTGISIIECADYMENEPLGRAEWIKFFGLLTGMETRADSLFRETERRYLELKKLTGGVQYRPRLMVGKKYGLPWNVASGESFMASLYKDAGADYIFRYLPGTGGTPLSFETILEKAVDADIWLLQYNLDEDMTYDALRSEYSPYSHFGAFRNRNIYGCNTSTSFFYEEVGMNPDYLLADLIALFHPELLPKHKPRYFFPLEFR